MLKSFFTLILAIACLSTFAQSADSSVFLKWKLKPGEALVYKTVMDETDTAGRNNLGSGMMKMLGFQDTSNMAEMNRTLKEMIKGFKKDGMVVKLTEKRKNIIDIEMETVDNSKNDAPLNFGGNGMKDSLQNIGLMLSKMTGGITLRGAIYEDGRIESFYLHNAQRNLVSLFFQLPAKPIKPGDTWSLDTHLISLDQNFICDTSYLKNQVLFKGIEIINGEHIADLEYNITEYADGHYKPFLSHEPVKMTTTMTYHALAKFSIEKGRWVFYEGLMSHLSTGIMPVQSAERYALVAQ